MNDCPRHRRWIGPLTLLLWMALPVSAATLQDPVSGTTHVPSMAGETSTPPHLPALFRTAKVCMACHTGITTSGGQDISIGADWRASMMANAARDPYWQAAVRRETLDHPAAGAAIEDECSRCHMPMARYTAHRAGAGGSVFDHLSVGSGVSQRTVLAEDGVSCALCHQIEGDNLGTEESLVGGFEVDGTLPLNERPVFGPFDVDAGRTTLMRSASGFRPTRGAHIQSSELCATCHTLITHALGDEGEVIGELPEQVPYQEWRHSDYPGERSCQSCHMPIVREPVPVTGVLGQPREEVSRHVFRGGNFFVLSMLNRYRGELGVRALPQELDRSVLRTIDHLQSATARIEIVEAAVAEGETLEFGVVVTNLAGHKLPTAYPSRRSWLRTVVTDRGGDTIFASGVLENSGAIRGNDNDANPNEYEPHYGRIESEDQVQIYEAILAGPDGAVTTGLLTAVRYVKDNRVPPKGFRKATAGEWIAVREAAVDDADFDSGEDRVVYAIDVTDAEGPFTVEAELWYQPIGYRWAWNLEEFDARETRRFVSYYNEMSGASGVVLAGDRTAVPPGG